jgi:lactate dehydrogenase-like 2-hydroxyacid dehydrogenase
MKPLIYVTRHLPEPAGQKLVEFCQPEIWDVDTPPAYEEIRARLPGKTGLLCMLTDRIDAGLMDAAPGLRVISQCAVGYDNVDVAAATSRGIAVGNTPGVLTETTADFAFTLLMAAARRVVEGADFVRAGRWQTWGLTLLLGQDIHGATLGLVGLGRIGAAMARRARGFDMHVLYYDLARQPEREAELSAEFCPLEELLRRSDFVSLHVNLTAQTRGLIGAPELARMKPTAILVNTSRGPVVDTEALYTALSEGRLAHAALDVTDPEPLPAGHKLLSLPNVTIVPHIASASVATRTRMALMAVENLEAGLKGDPLPYVVSF